MQQWPYHVPSFPYVLGIIVQVTDADQPLADTCHPMLQCFTPVARPIPTLHSAAMTCGETGEGAPCSTPLTPSTSLSLNPKPCHT